MELGSLSFSAVGALGLAPLAVLLVLIYRQKNPENQLMVSSLIVLKHLKRKRLQMRRFKPPLRFFLEFLAMLLIAAALSIPAWEREGDRVAVVVDNTLSMRARESDGAKRLSRMELAGRELETRLAEQRNSSYSLFTTSPVLTRVADAGPGFSSVVEQLHTIAPTLGTDSLEAAIGELAESGEYDRIQVISDREPELTKMSLEPKNQKQTQVSALRIGHPVSNIFVQALRWETAAPLSERVIVASVALSGLLPTHAAVRLSGGSWDRSGTPMRELAQRTLRLEPGQVAQARFELTSSAKQLNIFHLEILSNPGSQANALLDDDAAWLSASALPSRKLLVVSPDAPGDSIFGLRSIGSFVAVHHAPESFAALRPDELAQYSLLIFHKSAPANVPLRPTLLVLPPADNPFLAGVTPVVSPRVSSWAASHPVTSYLKVPLLKPRAGLVFDVPLWAQPVVNVEQGAIVALGESRGARFVASGIELLPFEGAKTPVSSVLTLNILGWLSGGRDLTTDLRTASALRLEPGHIWRLTSPDRRTHEIDTRNGDAAFFRLESSGPYHLYNTKAADSRLFVANTFYPEESLTAAHPRYRLKESYWRFGLTKTRASELWPWLIAGALLVMSLELLLYLFLTPRIPAALEHSRQKAEQALEGA